MMRNGITKFACRGVLLPVLLSGGCHGIGDPACAVRDERADQHARDLFYHPNASLTGLGEASWYRCPVHWQPECPPLWPGQRPARRVPAAREVLALPESDSAERPESVFGQEN